MLVVAQFLMGTGLFCIFLFSQLAKAKHMSHLLPITKFWRLTPVAPMIKPRIVEDSSKIVNEIGETVNDESFGNNTTTEFQKISDSGSIKTVSSIS